MKKLVVSLFLIAALCGLFILVNFINYESTKLTGSFSSAGIVGLSVLQTPGTLYILYPENDTYYFALGEDLELDLNVSATFDATTWNYYLYDLKHGGVLNKSGVFSPNTTFTPVRWANELVVIASNGTTIANDSVTFFVSVPNSAPVLGYIDDEVLACEGSEFSYGFNATDVDEDDLSIDVSPKDPIFAFPINFEDSAVIVSEIYSGILSKSSANKTYSETITVNDGQYVDSAVINISVIEINEDPSYDGIGVQTVYTQGENSNFSKQVVVSDVEDGNAYQGNLGFNLSFLTGTKFFDINATGYMNFTGNESYVGNYDINVCINDTPLDYIHPNISICGEDGSSNTVCTQFQLTVTDENRPPTILSYTPSEQNISRAGAANIQFNVTPYDPDGTIPDVYWYVDDAFEEYDPALNESSLTYIFGCGVSGLHTVEVVITDGVLNDSFTWNVNVQEVPCTPGTSGSASGGGGGGGGGEFCSPKWSCGDWHVCQSISSGIELGLIFQEDYRDLLQKCDIKGYLEKSCGFQVRNCLDINSCGIEPGRPDELQSCKYIESPSCKDGVKNCHDGLCEVLVDCGGPCNACPTCSDNIQNQGERGVDCGGPCPYRCVDELAVKVTPTSLYLILASVLVLLMVLVFRIIRIIAIREKLRR